MPNDAKSLENQSQDGQRLPPETAARLMRLATYASVSVASVLIAAKFAAWVSTGAVSLLSTLIDSLLDVGASLLNLIAVRHALEPADREHRFGHGKAEALSGLAQAAFICGSAVFLTIEAGERLLHPRGIDNTAIGYWVMVLAIVLTLALVLFQRHVVRQTGSVAITADSAHYRMDLLVNISVIVSLILVSNLGWTWADPAFALAIAAYIVWGAWQIGMDAYHMLMDRELADDERRAIRDIALAHPEVLGVHDLRTRSSGHRVFIQMHLEMDGDISLHDAHKISDAVEAEVMEAFPNAEVLIHEDPEGIEEERAAFH
ncbi:MAG: cation diffusion facilitator family transporter [Proteobacteria bacterium]|nr:cation diffusion facilitator family transporter [Pseudomonadota bacterium]